MNISWIAALLKGLGAVCLTFVILWHVAHHAGPPRGKVIVHVPQPDVLVKVDERRYHVGSITESPVVCELEPGRHVVEVRRDGDYVGGQSFIVEAGEEVVLCPCPRLASVATQGQSPRPAHGVVPASLAIDSRRPRPGPIQHPAGRRHRPPLARREPG